MNIDDYREDLARLAAMDKADALPELGDAAKKHGIDRKEFVDAVNSLRFKLNKAAREEAKKANKAQSVFEVGSVVEIAKNFKKHLIEEFTHVVFDEGKFWTFRDTEWIAIPDNKIHKWVHRYDGIIYGDGSVIKLDSHKIDSIMRETSVLLDEPQWFANAVRGVACLNGMIVFDRNGVPMLQPHDPEHRSRHTMQANWNPGPVNITGSRFEQFLDTMLKYVEHGEQYRYLFQEIFGAVIAGIATRLKQPKCFILTGATANNGKSTFIALLKRILPASAVVEVPPDKFKKQEFVIELAGKTLNTSDELSSEAMTSDIFKMLVDGKNEVMGRALYNRPAKFLPTALHMFATQYAPKFQGGIDRGVRRRVVIINFPMSIPDNEQVFGIEDEIVENEMDLVLAWAVEGASRLFRQQNYTLPVNVNAEVEQWVRDNDSVLAWWEKRVRITDHPALIKSCGESDQNSVEPLALDRRSSDGGGETSLTYSPYMLFKHYRDWARLWEIGRPVEKAVFFRRLLEICPDLNFQRKNNTRRTIAGLMLLSKDDGDAADSTEDEDGSITPNREVNEVVTKIRSWGQ